MWPGGIYDSDCLLWLWLNEHLSEDDTQSNKSKSGAG